MLNKKLLLEIINDRIKSFKEMEEYAKEAGWESSVTFNRGGIVALETIITTVQSGLCDKREEI